MRSGKGVLAEYIIAKPDVVTPKPSNISHADAASFPLAGLTAYMALVTNGKLKEGGEKRVFVNGGSGGVGAWAVQVAISLIWHFFP
jgi:NADPH:quinone reductase-like Zn-dependent oxidoreductase